MDPIDRLRQLELTINSQEEPSFSYEQLQSYFEDIVLVARTSEGYNSLCWDVGAWLLLLAGEKQNILFNTYGYPAISAILSDALATGSLPNGLGWYVSGFLPSDIDGDVMLGVLTHPVIHASLEQCLAQHEFTLNLELLTPGENRLSIATVRLLRNLHRVGLSRQTQLMWAARLIQHITQQNPAQELSVQLVLEGLLSSERYVNAFYWLKTYYISKASDDLKDIIFEVVSELIKIAMGMKESGYRVLGNMSYDDELETLLYASKRTQILLSFAFLWALFMQGIPIRLEFIDRSTSLLWERYPNIALLVKRLSNWSFQICQQSTGAEKPATALDYLHTLDRKAKALDQIKENLDRLPNYRRRGSPFDLWKECRDQVFMPLVSDLEAVSSGEKLKSIRQQIRQLDPENLITSSETYRSTIRHRKLDSDAQRMLLNDFQEYVDGLMYLADLCYKGLVVQTLIHQTKDEIDWIDLNREYCDLIEQWPSLDDHLRCFFYPCLTN